MISSDNHQGNSESDLMSDIYTLADAGASVIQVRTREPVRTALVLRKNILSSVDSEYREWDCVNGFRSFNKEDFADNRKSGDNKDFVEALGDPLAALRNSGSSVNAFPDKIHYYVFIDPHPFIEKNPYVTELIQQYAAILPTTNICLILVTPDIALTDIPAGTLLLSDMRTPSAQELERMLTKIIENAAGNFAEGSDLDEEDIRKLSYLGLGMTLYELETYAAIAIIDASTKGDQSITMEAMTHGISLGKISVVKQSDILELYPSDSMANVGGMQKLKDWVDLRSNCYSDEAKEFGIETPKGLMLVGTPGCGKSLVAKAVSSSLGVPLIRLDFGRVFSKYVGDSESRIRAALKMVEDMSPICLLLDELDKGLGGSGSGSDGGTSSRVLGTFLTWMQENTAPVFVIATANRVDGLPPELLRKGRLDAVFSVTLPTAAERLEVLEIHLRKRKRDLKFSKEEVFAFTKASDTYVPAEIESAVKDALIAAFSAGEDLSMTHILDALGQMVPMAKSNAEQIERIVAWSRDNATPVNYDQSEVSAVATGTPTRRLTRRASR